jgi:two-component system sensor histidine kinase UhpB
MTTELEHQLASLRQGDHVCRIYESKEEQLAAAVPFMKEGLARGERCLYVADDLSVEAIVGALAAAGVDVAHEREQGALVMPTKGDTYLQGGKFEPQAMIDFLGRAETQALTDGFSGLRVAGEMTWALGPEIGCERLIEFEALFNNFLANSRGMFLCQYNRSRFDAAVIHDVLRTHPVAILGDLVFPNPYYEPPELLLSPERQASAEFKAKRVDWWIAQVKRARAAEQERERVLEKLKQSERRLAEAQRVAHIGSWERDLRTNHVTWSDELYRLFGLRADEMDLSYQQFLNHLVPEDVARTRALVDEAIRERRSFTCDYRITLADGSVHVLHDRGGIILNDEGEPIRLVGTAQDVTELRRAEQATQEYATRLKTLSRRLLEVQEAERRHLARELHDEIGQMLTGLRLLLNPKDASPTDVSKPGLEQARKIVDELLEQIRGLSFDLRPAALDQLGLVPALLTLFERCQEQAGMLVDFKHKGVEGRIATEVETAAYRIVQEALTNVIRHAEESRVTVRIWATDDELSVQIEDQGRGFDPEAAMASPRSSGLAGMRERVLLLGGQLTVDSRPGEGTQITAELPLHGPASKP